MPRQAFSIRLNPQEKVRYQTLATARGISLGEWTREAMKSQAESEEYLDFLQHTYEGKTMKLRSKREDTK